MVIEIFCVGVNVAVYVLPLPLIVPNVPPYNSITDDVNDEVGVSIVNVIIDVWFAYKTVDEAVIVHVTAVTTVLIERPTVLEENVVVASLLVPDTEIEPLIVLFSVGVKVAVYVDPLFDVVTFDRLPPTTVINELLKSVVDVLIANVTVAVCPGVNDVRVEVIVQLTVVTTVFIIRSTVLDANVIVPSLVVPDTEIEPD